MRICWIQRQTNDKYSGIFAAFECKRKNVQPKFCLGFAPICFTVEAA